MSKNEFDLIIHQYQEGIITFRTQISLLIQIITVLVVGNITVVGFAFQNISSTLLFVGAVFPIAIIIASRLTKKLMNPIIENCLEIEQKYLSKESPKLIHGFASKILIKYDNESISKINFTNSRIFRNIFYLISIGQILLGFLLHYYFNWYII
ncbi:hypothetical protein [uncultured Psychroserpens sp.]|uniref:hypothetical protein n=1 Tax=uncultured Psychroserpens sp. TaxID=255436 RepID=UPI00261D6B7D|nr:hypothetical protein [uncultured Psychroserpens sp.]